MVSVNRGLMTLYDICHTQVLPEHLVNGKKLLPRLIDNNRLLIDDMLVSSE